jgi:large subunit ribosomal protein L28
MAKCSFTGTRPLKGCKVSHSHRRSKRWLQVNIKSKRIWDEERDCFVRLRISTRALRTITKKGLAKAARDAGFEY